MSDDFEKGLGDIDGFTLEEILAEYKSEAYIEGQRKTPSESLRQLSDEIIKEARGNGADEAAGPELAEVSTPISVQSIEDFMGLSAEEDEPEPLPEPVREEKRPAEPTPAEHAEVKITTPRIINVSEIRTAAHPLEDDGGDDGEKRPRTDFVRDEKRRARARRELEEIGSALDDDEPLFEYESDEDEEVAEPTPQEAVKLYASGIRAMKLRSWAVFFLCLVMAGITYSDGLALPVFEFLFESPERAVITLIVLQFLTLFLSADIFGKAIADIFRMKMDGATLAAITSVVSLLDGAVMIALDTAGDRLPYSAVCSFAMLFAMIGTHYRRAGLRYCFRVAGASEDSYVVTRETDRVDPDDVLIKKKTPLNGFVTNTLREDITSKLYHAVTPLFILAAIVFSVICSMNGAQGGNFLQCFTALTAVSAPFSSMLAFSVPFRNVAKRLALTGAAVAGWYGAGEIKAADAVVVGDSDVFPPAALSMNGIKIIGDLMPEFVIACCASLVIEAGSGLAGVFSELTASQGVRLRPVDDFSAHESGGYTGNISGYSIYVGSSGFLTLMGIRFPQEMSVKNAVFCAIDGELAGIFAINYKPMNSVQNALLSVLRVKKLKVFFAMRDFNITPLMLKQKFKIPTDDYEYLTVDERHRLSDQKTRTRGPQAAVVIREGMAPLAEVMIRSRRLRSAAAAATVLSILCSAIGMLIVYYICYAGVFSAASASNILSYMLLWLVPVLLIVGSVGGS